MVNAEERHKALSWLSNNNGPLGDQLQKFLHTPTATPAPSASASQQQRPPQQQQQHEGVQLSSQPQPRDSSVPATTSQENA